MSDITLCLMFLVGGLAVGACFAIIAMSGSPWATVFAWGSFPIGVGIAELVRRHERHP